ncbi:uncharacterized protein [Asterias amurensis]|uniref:uncharacterized protein n=1 Tax=Asterias amurensis TaxID=7602 RepID=UPI003AB600CF
MKSTVLILIAAVVTVTTAARITPTMDTLTVGLGEAIHLSCVITLSDTEAAVGLSEVRWYRGSSFVLYGSIDVERAGCPSAGFPCPEGITTDNRGTVRYEIGASNDPVLTLTINSSTLEDNTSFFCGIIKVGGSSHTSSGITVTVYVPEATTPNGQQTPLGTTLTASTTNSPHTATMISSHQTSTTSIRDTTLPTRQITVGSSIAPYKTSTTQITLGTTINTISPLVTGTSTNRPVSLTVPILAVVVAACMVINIILLIIIAYLVSSRKRGSKDADSRLGLRSPDEEASQGNGPTYQNTNQPHTYEKRMRNITNQDGNKSTGERPLTVHPSPTHYEPVQAGVGGVQQAGAQRQPGRGVRDTSAVTTGDAESGYQALEMTNQPSAEYTNLDIAILDG